MENVQHIISILTSVCLTMILVRGNLISHLHAELPKQGYTRTILGEIKYLLLIG
jgi:hypothetical protein